ncbi:carbon monoxide dehydrogenase small chain (plasmid) [Rhizobium sp. CCGE 510]|nr:carbon monoxide dehydrogenase small chain [Rhizobium sp. CCGE 510]
MSEKTITVSVNGAYMTRTIEARTLLSDFLRQDLCLTGTHVGCEHGVCGACTVILDGRSARSCLTLAVQATGAKSKPSKAREASINSDESKKRSASIMACNADFVRPVSSWRSSTFFATIRWKPMRRSGKRCRGTSVAVRDMKTSSMPSANWLGREDL